MRSALLAAVFGLVATSSTAWADPPPDFPPCNRDPTQADLEGAAGSHRAAKAYYERGEYDRAIQLWRDAYNFDCTKPAVFLNMANAYEKKGDKVAAVAMLETYLVRAPKDAADAATIAAKVNNLKNSIKQETVPAASGSGPVPTSTPPPAAPTATAGPDTATPPPGERPFGVVPWIVTGVGVAAVVGGIIPLVIGSGKIADAEVLCGESHQDCPNEDDRTDEEEQIIADGASGQDMTTLGWVLIGVGGAAVAGGLVWQLVFNDPRPAAAARSKPQLRVTPTVGGDRTGLLVSGSF